MTTATSDSSHASFPSGTHYAVTTGFGTDFKGLTTAMLIRSRTFVEQTGQPITILTHGRDDYDQVRAELVDRGILIDGMTLINLFEDIRTWDDETAKRNLKLCSPVEPALSHRLRKDDPDVIDEKYCRTKFVDGTITQVDHLRDDGSVVIAEHRSGGPRRYVHHSSAGMPTGIVDSSDDLLARWIDTLPRDPVAWMIVDSRVSARLLLDYRRPDVVLMHVLHHSHLAVGAQADPRTVIIDSKAVLERMDDLDAIVLLTDSQLQSINDLFGDGTANRFAISNVGLLPTVTDFSALTKRRDRRRGVMLARYDGGKRVDYAIRAIASAADSLNPRKRPTLDVYGGGPRLDLLQDEIETVSARERTVLRRFTSRYFGTRLGRRLAVSIEKHASAPRTRLHDHVPDAREKFWDASFSLLTSKDEACPLVVIESMARGAIPICFDIDFGPRDMITDGVDGVLIPFKNRRQAEKALAAAIRRTVSMSHKDLTAMRLAAHRRAQDFDGTHVTQQWIEAMSVIRDRRFPDRLPGDTTVVSAVSAPECGP